MLWMVVGGAAMRYANQFTGTLFNGCCVTRSLLGRHILKTVS